MTFIQAEVFGGGGGGTANYLDTTYDPVALYLLDDSLADSSASNLPNLTVNGNENWTDVGYGLRGFELDGSSQVYLSSAESEVQITGNLTIEMILRVSSINASASPLVIYCAASGEEEVNNSVYQIALLQNTNQLQYFCEYGAGVNVSYNANAGIGTGAAAVLLAMVRSSGNVTFYANGVQIGDTSVGLTTASGGSNATLKIGHANIDGGAICSVKILDVALSADQIKAEYNLSLGPVVGELP